MQGFTILCFSLSTLNLFIVLASDLDKLWVNLIVLIFSFCEQVF